MAVLLAVACSSSETPAPSGAAGTNSGGSEMSGAGESGFGGGGLAGSSGSGAAGSDGVASGEAGEATAGEAGGKADGGAAGLAGAPGECEAVSMDLAPWPGPTAVQTLDAEDAFQSDLSGLTYESPGVLWAVDNLTSKLFRLTKSDAGYAPDSSNGWTSGKALRFPGGTGAPDAEGVTLGVTSQSGVYVASERDLGTPNASRLSILRYDASVAVATLNATHEWNLTPLLPAVGANLGIEAVTWVPDSYLVAHGFYDESKSRSYAPADYAEHGAGVFVVGVEATGKLYALVLEHPSSVPTLVASISTPLAGAMGLEFDRDAGRLWAHCDDTCDNESLVLGVSDASGHFEVERHFARPSGLPNSNHEGIALAPDSECRDGVKPFFWTDDADADGFSLRQGAVRCDCL